MHHACVFFRALEGNWASSLRDLVPSEGQIPPRARRDLQFPWNKHWHTHTHAHTYTHYSYRLGVTHNQTTDTQATSTSSTTSST
jgi:hypothetical protein